MKVGDIVKVRTHPTNPTFWQEGILLSQKKDQCQVQITNGTLKEVTVHQLHCKKFSKLNWEDGICTDLTKHSHENFPKLVKLLNEAIAEIIPNEDKGIEVHEKDNTIFGYYNTVSIESVVVEKESIGQFREIPGWQVTTWKTIPATRHEPENIDGDSEESIIMGHVVELFIQKIVNSKLTDFLNGRDYDPQYDFRLL